MGDKGLHVYQSFFMTVTPPVTCFHMAGVLVCGETPADTLDMAGLNEGGWEPVSAVML